MPFPSAIAERMSIDGFLRSAQRSTHLASAHHITQRMSHMNHNTLTRRAAHTLTLVAALALNGPAQAKDSRC
jgi:hypothetical protein